jgi:DeoR family transcriptional regulator of aga operon
LAARLVAFCRPRFHRPTKSTGEQSTAAELEVRVVMVEVANGKPLKLLVEERRRRILELLDKEERATVEELADRFDVSTVTIRGDLDVLADGGALVRSHGGALKRLDHGDVRLSVKETLNPREKVRIGHAASRLVRQGDTVILDSGTTTAEIAKQLKFLKLESLTVITNGLNIAMHLANLPHVRVIMIGGLLRQMSYSTVGPQAEQILSGLNADHLFLGVDGLDPDIGLTTPDVLEAQLNALMIRVSREVTVVADSSKFSRRSMSVIAGVGDIQRIITDHKADPALVTALRARNIHVMLV